MFIEKHLRRCCGMFLASMALSLPAWGQTVVNDSFESGSFSGSWASTTSAGIQTGAGAVGSSRFANLPGSAATRLGARFDAVQSGGTSNFTIEAYVRVQSSATRQLQLILSTSSSSVATNAPALNLRHHAGSWSSYDGQSWIPIPGINTLRPGAWHRLRLTGRNWGTSQASYDIEVSSAGGGTYTSAASGLRVYQNSNANAYTQPARYFVFTTEFENTVGFAVDNVAASIGAPHQAPPPALDPSAVSAVIQSSGSTAPAAIDNDPSTVAVTDDMAGSFWEMELNRNVPLTRVQIVAPSGAGYTDVLNHVVLKIFGMDGQVIFTATVSGTIPGEPWTLDFPANLQGRILRLELPSGQNNGAGDQRIALGELRVFSAPLVVSGTNYALNRPCYMVRLTDTLNPASYANDGSLATTMQTTDKTVDAYWETDLGQERALHHVRVVGLDGGVDQYRLSRATLRLYDENHNSVYARRLSNTGSSTFDLLLPGPVRARYVRVGYENKIRSSVTDGIEWYLRIREVEAYGVPVEQVGILDFSSAVENSNPGQPVTLSWQTNGLQSLRIHPTVGSVGAVTAADGSGQLVVTPQESTCYVMVGTTPTRTYVRSVTVRINEAAMPPRISELVASNRLSFRDGFKDAPDWIELHNPNGNALDLTGYGLSDEPANPVKWTFPSGTIIPAHGYLVVCASGRELAGPDEAGYLHADFALSSSAESVVLSSPGAMGVIDSINYTAQDEDLAYGRTLDGEWGFLEPTPGAPNLATSYLGWLMPPVFSETRGVRTGAFSLTLTNPNPDSHLLYSIDGGEPSLAYAGPLPISSSRSVRANVRRDGYRSPRTVTHSYLFPSQVPTGPNMNQTYAGGTYLTRQQQGFQDLPLVSLSVPNLPDDYVEIEGSAEFFLPGSATPVQINCGVERFGGAWTNFDKKSYKLGFSADYGARKLEAPLFNGFDRGFPVKEQFDSLELRAGNHDMALRGCYLSGRFIEDTTLEMGSLNPHGRFAHLFVNGTYWGMYDMRERMVDAFLAEYLGGAKEDYVNVRGNDNYENNTFIPGTPEPPNRALWESVRANRSSYTAIKDKVDVSHLIDFMLVWFFGTNENEYRCAGPIAPGSGFKFWLADSDGYLAFDWSGGFPAVTAALNNDRTANEGPGSIFGSLVTEGHPDFKVLLADRIQKHFFNNGAFTATRSQARLTARINEIQNAIVAECARWGYRTPENWSSAAETVRTGFLSQRGDRVLAFLRNRGLFPGPAAPVLTQHGGSVSQGYPLTFNGTAGTVYFTLDGTDPRLPGGAISPAAQSWSGTAQTLIPPGSTWKYWDKGSLPAVNWNTASYNDATWSSGPAQLGYGDGDEATTVGFGPNSNDKYPTTYFRKTVNLSNPSQFSQLTLGLVRDDGAVVYINGTEVARSNMPAGTIGYTTTAASAIGGADESAVLNITVPANVLVAGPNVIAVELHQHGTYGSINSTDLSFDLSLTGSASGVAAILNSNTRVMARVWDGTTWSALTDATFRVAWPLVANGPYQLNGWSAASVAGTHPPNMTFYQTSTAVADPGLAVEMEKAWDLPYNRTSRSRINGLDSAGFSFINTSDTQAEAGSGYVGTAVLALNTIGAQDIRVTWTGGTVVPNTRDYGIRLQYRVGDAGAFADVLDGVNPVEYLRNATAGHSQLIGPVTLPVVANNQPLLQLRWKYYFRSGASGARPQLRVDDIQVSAGHPAADRLVVEQAPLAGQSGRPLGPVTVQARSANGALATGFNGQVQISTVPASPVSGTIIRNAVNGTVVFDDLVISGSGGFILRAASLGLADGDSDSLTRVVALGGEVVPRFIQGGTPVNDARVPWAARFSLSGLRPNSVYRYANRFLGPADTPDSDGAGNMIFAYPGGFIRSVAGVSFETAGLNSGHGHFTTDAGGNYSGWFVAEPTGNERFVPGGSVFPLLLLNDGEGGGLVHHRLPSDEAVTVLSFGTASTQGSAVRGTSDAPGRSFIVLHDNPSGAGRPLAATPVEATGAVVDSLYADFYQNEVSGLPGCWGTILPNSLAGGAALIELRDGAGTLLGSMVSADGHRPTAGLSSGLVPTGIRFPGATDDGFARWQARHFTLEEMAPGGIGAASASSVGDDVPNLLRYAFGIPAFGPGRERLPSASLVEVAPGEQRLRFQFHRLMGSGGLSYDIMVSENLSSWQVPPDGYLTDETVVPDSGGITESVSRDLPVVPGDSHRMLRLRVTRP